jgi:DNA mismatch repair ATPase MutS
VANSITLIDKSVLLTGSNMSGKTTFIRAIGINAILAQTIGTCFAKECIMPPLRIFSAMRISDDLLNDKSYYFEEILTIKAMVEESQSETQALFLLDELFKGTNTVERIAAGKAVLSYLNKGQHIVFVATHDIELTVYLKDSFDLYHFTEVVENDKIAFDYKLRTGNLKTRNAIRILEINHYPIEVISEAKGLFEIMTNSMTSTAQAGYRASHQ